MFKKIVIILTLILVLWGTLPEVNAAEESEEYCINSTHRYWERNIYFNSTLYQFKDTENCSYGCINGICLPAPTESHDMSIIIGIMLVAFFFIYGAFKFDNAKHAPLQILFLFVGVFFVLINFAVLGEIADASAITLIDTAVDLGYGLITYTLVVLILYFTIWLIYEVLIAFNKINRVSFGKEEE